MLSKRNLYLAFIAVLFYLAIAAKCYKEERNVTLEWNPGCDGSTSTCNSTNSRGSFTNLVHVKLTGATDITHLLFSDIAGFTIMFARTNLTCALSVNWTLLLSSNRSERALALAFNETPAEWFAYEIAHVYEFDDVDGTADMTQAKQTYDHLTSSFIWKQFQFNTTENFGWFEGSINFKH